MGERVRAVMVGCGGISHAWLTAARDIPELDMVGLVDLREEAASGRSQEFGLTSAVVSADLEAVLDELSPDAVFDCTPPEVHVDITVRALEHGCHVLGEKPLADSMANARRCLEAASKADRLFAVIQNRRYDPRIRRLRKLLISGELGKLTTLNSDFYIGAHFGGFRDQMEHVLLMDMAIHTFDAARFISGADPVSVYCKEWNPAGSWYDHDASAVAVFGITGGLVYTYRGSWCSEGLNTTWECDWRAIGTQGSATWDGAEAYRAQKVSATGGFHSDMADVVVPPAGPDTRSGGHAGLLREFVDCVLHGGTPETVGTDNIKSLAMVLGAVESAETGREVEVRL
ncbi:MAG TPA: Gfo/Idh/MocA family oxidoreductase [Armatimonadota bacterium]